MCYWLIAGISGRRAFHWGMRSWRVSGCPFGLVTFRLVAVRLVAIWRACRFGGGACCRRCRAGARAKCRDRRSQGQDFRRANGAADFRQRPAALQRVERHEFLFSAARSRSQSRRIIIGRWTVWRCRAFSTRKPTGPGTSKTPMRAGRRCKRRRPRTRPIARWWRACPICRRSCRNCNSKRPRRRTPQRNKK